MWIGQTIGFKEIAITLKEVTFQIALAFAIEIPFEIAQKMQMPLLNVPHKEWDRNVTNPIQSTNPTNDSTDRLTDND
jgi:hypothetical protein